jgi:hypothetical protein
MNIELSREELECLYNSLCDEGGPNSSVEKHLVEKFEVFLKPYWDREWEASADDRKIQEEHARALHLATGKTHYIDPLGVPNSRVDEIDTLLRMKRLQG